MPNQLATAQIVTTQLAIADWVQNLAAIPEREFTLGNVHNYFLNHHIQPETLAKYCYFSNPKLWPSTAIFPRATTRAISSSRTSSSSA